MMSRVLTYIWRFSLMLLFLGGLGLITLWVLREYDIPFFVKQIPDDAFEPLITLFTYITGFSGVGAVVSWITQKRSGFVTDTDEEALRRDRHTLLSILKARYARRLEDTLDRQARIVLGLHPNSDAVKPAWQRHLRGVRKGRAIPQGTSILDVFDQAEGQLLILGAPGAGKTTLLLELAQALLARAEGNEREPIPVIINLSTWGKQERSLDEWLSFELYPAAGVSKPFAEILIKGRHLLLLLDGLDEVAEGKRADCIRAINDYCQEHGPLHMVVCSRKKPSGQ
jgi:hypothetical protein